MSANGENGENGGERIALPSKLSLAVVISLVTGGFSAWYGMTTRVSLIESHLATLGGRIDSVASDSDRALEAMNGRLDRVIQEYQDHVRSPAHAVGERIASTLDRRMEDLERRVDEIQRAEEQHKKRSIP